MLVLHLTNQEHREKHEYHEYGLLAAESCHSTDDTAHFYRSLVGEIR